MTKMSPTLLTLVFAYQLSGQSISSDWLISKESTLSIQGKSNVNSFACEYSTPFEEAIVTTRGNRRNIAFGDNEFRFKVRAFDCDHSRMTSDFRKTMKVDEFPELLLEIKQLQVNESGNYNLDLNITVAQQQKANCVALETYTQAHDSIVLKGSHNINISDYDLIAPQALWGMIKVKDQITINFYIELLEQEKNRAD